MRIAFDATSAAFEKKTGTGVYTQEIIKAFQNEFPEDDIFNTYRLVRGIKGKKYLLEKTKNTKNHFLLDPVTFWRGYSYDIFHGLNARLPVLWRVPNIVTIHDLFSVFGNYSEEKFKIDQKRKIESTLKRATHIITPATFTKNELINRLNVNEIKITVVGEGVREVFLNNFDKNLEAKKLKNKFNIQYPYFLFVGTLEKRKNIFGVIDSFYQFNQKSPNTHRLVLIGSSGFGIKEIKEKINNLKLQELIVFLEYMHEQDLALFYRCCTAFLFLSLEEGYGIPVIESMSCGAPVISSNTTSLPEVGGGYSFLVSPSDTNQTVELMIKMAQAKNHELLEKVNKGQKYARHLTWNRVARQLREVYLRVINQYHERRSP
ncbi:MAG: glycosyltransferase family 4 protein [Oligoflexia bacterium]|nr:glycosyltransferase family 4 protein [Oligoflexia bacterium]